MIGITGTIGSGKSSVSRFWAAYSGLPLIDIDLLCRELLVVDRPGWRALRENLASSYFLPDGQLDRSKLRGAIFTDSSLRQRVDSLIHPLAHELLLKKAAFLDGRVLVDVPLLFEADWQEYFQATVMVYADRQTCCRRISARDNISPQEAEKAVRSQMDCWEKALLAHHVIDNRFCWLLTRRQATHLAELLAG